MSSEYRWKKKWRYINTHVSQIFTKSPFVLFLKFIFKINGIDVCFWLILVAKTSFVVCVSNDCDTAVLQKWLSCGCSIPSKLKYSSKKSWFPFPIISFLSSTFSIHVLFNSLPFPSSIHFFFHSLSLPFQVQQFAARTVWSSRKWTLSLIDHSVHFTFYILK